MAPLLSRCAHAMAPLLSRDLARAGTVTCAMAYAAGALRTLPGRVDGGAAVARRLHSLRGANLGWVTKCQTALITGGTSGLGLAMAAALARAGVKVAIAGRSRQRAVKAAASFYGAPGVGMDVGDESSVAAGVQQVWSRFGGIDLLVNNAGIGMRTVNPRFLSKPQ